MPSLGLKAAVPTGALRYHVAVHSLAERVLSHIKQQELLHAGDRVGVAVSGGIDSVTLLRLLLELRRELGVVVSVVHFNHKLRGAESDADQEFVAALARAHDLEFFCDSDDVAQQAAEDHVSLETAARELRYGFFRYLLGEGREPQRLKPQSLDPHQRGPEGPLFHENSNDGARLHKIATGHTLDDQAETVLMRMIRGAGMKGLGGIHQRIHVESSEIEEVGNEEISNDNLETGGEIIRPLLPFRHSELEHYLQGIGQPWREDATNADPSFTRNRVRKLLMPLLQKEFNPSVAENLSELAEIARGEEDYWENEVAGWMGTAVHWSEPKWAPDEQASLVQITSAPVSKQAVAPGAEAPLLHSSYNQEASLLREKIDQAPWLVMNASVDRLWFLAEPIAVQRRLIKALGQQAHIPLEFKHVEEILRGAAAQESSGKELSLPLGWKIVLEPHAIVFVTPDLRQQTVAQDYEYPLSAPGQTAVPEAGFTLEARRIPAADLAGYNPDNLLDAESLPGPFTVRNWRPGDRFWPAHTKSPKKIKELLQQRQGARPERKLWPVVVGVIADGQEDSRLKNGGEEEIVWMHGFATPAKFRVKPGRDALLISISVSEVSGSEDGLDWNKVTRDR
jgi:tRNA(Ile)-lysidine synthase